MHTATQPGEWQARRRAGYQVRILMQASGRCNDAVFAVQRQHGEANDRACAHGFLLLPRRMGKALLAVINWWTRVAYPGICQHVWIVVEHADQQ